VKKSVKKYSQGEMLPLETKKKSGGKLLHHWEPGGECFWRRYHAAGRGKRGMEKIT